MDEGFLTYLAAQSLLGEQELALVRQHKAWLGLSYEETFADLDLLEPRVLFAAWQNFRQRPFVHLHCEKLESKALGLFDLDLLKKHRFLPLGWKEGVLQVALDQANPSLGETFVLSQLDDACKVAFLEADPKVFGACLARVCQSVPSVAQQIQAFDYLAWQRGQGSLAGEAIMRLLDALLNEAIEKGVSDVHFEPKKALVQVRYRLDGVLQPVYQLHPLIWQALLVRIKVLAEMEVTEQSLPQDGRFAHSVGQRQVRLRVASLPVAQGESVVIRLLPLGQQVPDLEALGLDVEALAGLKKGLQQSSGIVLVAGPTGSGKSTSLAAMLKSLQGAQLAILSLENPIEYQMDWVIQTEVREGLGLGFAEGVRAMMRLDPDVVMIGEIRDAKTALTALQAARTGHLVLASVHASSFGQMKRRMVDLGVGEGELEGVLVGAFIQRLVRKRCPVCEGVGCAQCSQTGYAGRRPLIEVWSARGVCAQSFEQLCQQALEAGWLDEAERLRVFGARAGE